LALGVNGACHAASDARPWGGRPDFEGDLKMRTARRLVPALVGLALMAATAVGCQWPDGTRYVDTVFGSTTTTRDIPYRTTTDYQGNPITLKLDVYRPQGDTRTDRPAVIWGFGGAWMIGNKDQLAPYAVDSAKRGYVGITIDYRIRPQGGPLIDLAGDAYDDTIAAVEFVKAHAADYGVNPDAVVVAGYSAGAINAMDVAFWPGERGPATSPAAGAVAIAGFSFGQPAAGDPPILMFQGDSDTLVPYGTAQDTCDATKTVGNSCRFYTYPGVGHEIAATQQASIMERTADWIFEVVLYPLGYRP
jgi:acetyl esterase/lipase